MTIHYVNCHGPDAAGFMSALNAVCALAAASGTSTCYIAAATKQNFTQGIISDVLGKPFVTQLLNGSARYNDCSLLPRTKTINADRSGVTLAMHIGLPWLDKLIKQQQDHGVVYLPWTVDELTEFTAKYHDAIQA